MKKKISALWAMGLIMASLLACGGGDDSSARRIPRRGDRDRASEGSSRSSGSEGTRRSGSSDRSEIDYTAPETPADAPLAAVIDIDGTIADESERRSSAEAGGEMDWDIYNDPELAAADRPMTTAIPVLESLTGRGVRIFYVTGRPESLEETTRSWLAENGFPPGDGLFCRPRYSRTAEFKAETIGNLMRENRILFGAGDRNSDIEAYEGFGFEGIRIEAGSDEAWTGASERIDEIISAAGSTGASPETPEETSDAE